MIEFSHEIRDREGLHARPVTMIASEAMHWSSRVSVVCGDHVARASDLVGLMGLCARQGDLLVFRVEGDDAEEAAASLKTLVEDL